jgi:NADH-quinone oxidoreductase subunit G
MIGADPRIEAPLVNSRIRKTWLKGGLKIYTIGSVIESNYNAEYLGNDPRVITSLLDGTHPLSKALEQAKQPMIIVGTAALARPDGSEILAACKALADRYAVKDGWNGFNILHHAAARVGALDVGFVPAPGGKHIAEIFEGCAKGDIQLVYLLGADEFDMALLGKAFVIYQGHHGDDGAHRADVVLPGAAYTEKEATYVNMEGRAQRARRAVFAPGAAKEDWLIVQELSYALGKSLGYKHLSGVRAGLVKYAPHFSAIDAIQPVAWVKSEPRLQYRIVPEPFEAFIHNFYMTDPISRASKTMAECMKVIAVQSTKKVA